MLPHLRGRAAYLFSVIDRVRLDCRCAGGTTQTSRGREPPVIDSPLSPSPGKGRWKNSGFGGWFVPPPLPGPFDRGWWSGGLRHRLSSAAPSARTRHTTGLSPREHHNKCAAFVGNTGCAWLEQFTQNPQPVSAQNLLDLLVTEAALDQFAGEIA